MKKIIRLMAALAAVTAAFSCIEEANPEIADTSDGATRYEGEMVTLDFNLAELETKTNWDGVNHTWSDGDQIKIIWGSETDACTTATVSNGKVSATVGVADTYYAVYPETTAYTLAIPEEGSELQLSVTIPQTQDGSFKQANIMAAKTSKTELSFAFKNLTHIFKFTLSENSVYKAFQFASNSNTSDVKLIGNIPVTFNDDNVSLGTPTATNYVVNVWTLSGTGPFYVGIIPDADMTDGFGIKATRSTAVSESNGFPTNWSAGAMWTSSLATTRSSITNLKTLDERIRQDWFIATEAKGKGDGSDWDNAGDGTLLIKLLGNLLPSGNTVNGITNSWRLYGAYIHIAAGTYNTTTLNNNVVPTLQMTASNKTTILGGYPAGLSGTTTEGRDIETNQTIFTCRSTSANDRIFASAKSNTIFYDMTFDGVVFQGPTDEINTRGMAFYFNDGVSGNISFKNCTFKEFKSSNGTAGGVLAFNAGSGTLTANFTDCIFSNNKATQKGGGAIVVTNASANTTLKFNNCNFATNSAKGNGGALSVEGGNTILTNCTFTENTAVNGSAIFSDDAGDATTYSNATANVYIYNSHFTGNSASNQGTVRANGAGCAAIVNSTFYNNTSGNGDIFIRTKISSQDKAIKAFVISCTANGEKALYNQDANCYCYNSALNGYYANGSKSPNTIFNHSIFITKHGTKDNLQAGLYLSDNTLSETVTNLTTDIFGTYANGVIPVSGAALTYGMESTDLAALGEAGSALMTAMPLFDASKLTVDQNGTSREGKTVMGAYVGE